MKNLKKIFVLVCATFSLLACTENDSTELTGRIAMKGASVHTYLVLEDLKSKKSVKIANHEAFNLMQHQNEVLTLKVKLIKKAIGAGFPAVVEVLEVK
jgi:hypothetical protein